MKKIYISGPITGRSLGETVEHFSKIEKRILNAGFIAVNPIWLMPYGLTWDTYMGIARTILDSGEISAIVMLEGWEKSDGARMERSWAKDHGIPVGYETPKRREHHGI